MSEDSIKRSDAIKALDNAWINGTSLLDANEAIKQLNNLPSADRPQKVIAQITFDEEKLREIVKEAVERFKEEYEITDRPLGEWILVCDAEGEGDNLYRCSVCGCEYGCQEYDLPKYCGECGSMNHSSEVTEKGEQTCPKCEKTEYIRSFVDDFGIKDSNYRYKCINCNTYIK